MGKIMKKIFFLVFLTLVNNLFSMGDSFYQIDPSVYGDFSPDGALFLNIVQLEKEDGLHAQMLGLYNLRCCRMGKSLCRPEYFFRPMRMFDDDFIVALQWSPRGDYVAIVGRNKKTFIDRVYIYDKESLKRGHYKQGLFRGTLQKSIIVPGIGCDRPPLLTWNSDNRNLAFFRYKHPLPCRYNYQGFIIDTEECNVSNPIFAAMSTSAMPAWDQKGELLALLSEEERGFYSISEMRRERDPFFYFNRETHEVFDLPSLDLPLFLTKRRFFNRGMSRFDISHMCRNEKEDKLFFIDSLGKCEVIARIINKNLQISSHLDVSEIEKETTITVTKY
ncbi:TPA: hypothetical protein DIC20_02705 [Candidatus Dependentiae bacterium]|nr:MAG: hypothetical protein US13_C0009G0032 [candidate division TM6 bacterium GW2011_GWE2_36_25]HBR70206.1 hypothetical protein [Candidatus Dependentiae bacterium]HCU00590.1 hypothetical protein [Candidatus Dependentiae bacterium]